MTVTEFDLKGKGILVTGGAGFLGKQVIRQLCLAGADPNKITVPRSRDCDLRIMENCQRAVDPSEYAPIKLIAWFEPTR